MWSDKNPDNTLVTDRLMNGLIFLQVRQINNCNIWQICEIWDDEPYVNETMEDAFLALF